MCWSCVHGELLQADLTHLEVSTEMIETALMIERFYLLPGCSVGGPLHITTDDNNVTDHNLEYCRTTMLDPNDKWSNEYRTPERDALGIQILDRLQVMTEPERSVVCAMHHGDRYIAPGRTREFTYPHSVNVSEDEIWFGE